MKYNYVIFNFCEYTDVNYNLDDDYYVICLKDLENRDDVILNHVPLQGRSKLLRCLYNFHHSRLLQNKYWRFPFERIWYPLIYKNKFKDDKPICFVCIRYPSIEYLKYLRRKYPNCKIVKMSRDLIRIQQETYKTYTDAGVFDVWMSFDEKDCKEYGFPHFDEFESKVNVPIEENYPVSDVFFAGKAKDRLPRLIRIYDKLTNNKKKCLFCITNAREDEKVMRDGIVYLDKPLSYTKMLWYSVNSKCILEINQEGALGYTSRFLEAVMFNKLLITDNPDVKKSQFYNPNFISYIKSESDINPDFVSDIKVDFNYSGEFSPIHRIELIDSIL